MDAEWKFTEFAHTIGDILGRYNFIYAANLFIFLKMADTVRYSTTAQGWSFLTQQAL